MPRSSSDQPWAPLVAPHGRAIPATPQQRMRKILVFFTVSVCVGLCQQHTYKTRLQLLLLNEAWS